MKWWKVFLGLGLSIGVLIGVTSLYQVSVDSTMEKMGLAGADFAAAVDGESMREWRVQLESGLKCGIANRLRGTVEFILAGDSEQGQLSFRLAEQRVKCGAGLMGQGQVEVGTYEVLKGLGYMKSGYSFVLERGSVDVRVCEKLPQGEVLAVIDKLLDGTTGRVHDLILEDWGEVIELQLPVEAMCLDARRSRI